MCGSLARDARLPKSYGQRNCQHGEIRREAFLIVIYTAVVLLQASRGAVYALRRPRRRSFLRHGHAGARAADRTSATTKES